MEVLFARMMLSSPDDHNLQTPAVHMLQDFVDLLKLEAGEKVLDVGCGIGGGDFYIAESTQAYVHGIDLSVNMVLLALERAQQQQHTLVRHFRPVLSIFSTMDLSGCLSVRCYCFAQSICW